MTELTPAEAAALEEIMRRGLLPSRPLSMREVAAVVGVSHGTVQNVQTRALAKLRDLVGEDGR